MRPVLRPHSAPALPAARRWAPSLALAAVLFLPLSASAALVIDDDGTYDAATEGCDGSDPAFTTINAAHDAAVDGDTILACPGTYTEIQVHITKAITLQDSGAESTIIDGGGLTNAPSPGTLVISADGDVKVDGFTIQNPSRTPGGLAFGIQAESDHPVTFTITNNVIRGTGDPTAKQDYGFYSDGPNALEMLIFQHSTITETGIESHAPREPHGPDRRELEQDRSRRGGQRGVGVL